MSTSELEKFKESPVFALDEVVRQKKIIDQVFKEVMKKDVHYGTIPGTAKPSLYKPGAECITFMFRLSASYQIEYREIGDNGHREVIATCTLTHMPTGQVWGQAVGSCSTMEGKYRFRTGNVIPTDKQVPQEYWDMRSRNPKAALQLLGGPGHSTKKIDGSWMIVKAGEKCEHDNPADYHNTVLKMAQKRATTSAVIGCTAASDIFTVDVEDMPEVIDGAQGHEEKPADVVDVTPEPVKEDDSEKDWNEETARQEAVALKPEEQGQGEIDYKNKPFPGDKKDGPEKIDKSKANLLYAKANSMPGWDKATALEFFKDCGFNSAYEVTVDKFEEIKDGLNSLAKAAKK